MILWFHMKIVLFDFDGVIVDSFAAAYKINAARFNPLTAEEYRRWFDGNIGEELKKRLSENSVTYFFAEYATELGSMAIVPGIVEVIVALAQKYTLAIISSSHSSAIKKFLETHGLEKYFKEILGYDIETSKVIKIRTVMEESKISPNDCVLITDTLGDIREANEAGIKSLAVTWGYHDKETLESGSPYALATIPPELVSMVDQYLR